MKKNLCKLIFCFVFLIGARQSIEATITCRSYMTIKKGTLFVDPECVRCFGKITKIEADKAVLLSYKPIPKDQFLLYTKKYCKVTGDAPSLPVAILFTKESDSFSLEFLTRNDQEYYETCFKLDAKPQPQEYVWSQPREHITNPELREKYWKEQIEKLGYSPILFHSLWSVNKSPLKFRLPPQAAWIADQNLQIQLFINIIDAFEKGKIDKTRICNYCNGEFYVPDAIHFWSKHKYFFNTPNGTFLLNLTVDSYTKQINATLKSLVIATIDKGSFKSDAEGNLFTDPICKEAFGKFKILKSGRALLMCDQAIQENMFLYTGSLSNSRFALLNVNTDSRLTLKFCSPQATQMYARRKERGLGPSVLGLGFNMLTQIQPFLQ
jgi:hypothetical protein